jgi:hypothetical protein
MARVLLHRPLKERIVAIGFRDRGAQIIEDDAPRDTAEKHPGVFQAVNHGGDGL